MTESASLPAIPDAAMIEAGANLIAQGLGFRPEDVLMDKPRILADAVWRAMAAQHMSTAEGEKAETEKKEAQAQRGETMLAELRAIGATVTKHESHGGTDVYTVYTNPAQQYRIVADGHETWFEIGSWSVRGVGVKSLIAKMQRAA